VKKLILLRHAKSGWDIPVKNDAERPLNPRGLRDAPVMGLRIVKQYGRPALIVTSPATRAITTAVLIAQEMVYPQAEILIDDSLYCFRKESLLSALQNLDESKDNILCVAHNPAITETVNQLCAMAIENVPTCGMCCIQFESARWRDITRGTLLGFDYPKNRI
jgi:phosphohistidine phosphatase